MYLFTVQIRGTFGLTDRSSIESRFKYDAIEYYEEDIHWLGFSVIMLGINLEKIKFLIDVHSEKEVIKDDTGAVINDKTYGKSEIYFSAFLVFTRIVTMYATTKMRN